MPRLARTTGPLLLLLTAACFGAQHYEPAPLPSGEQAAANFSDRNLNDPALARFLAEQSATLRDSAWLPTQLALAAVFFRSDLTVVRRAVDVARAGEVTAGARPYPDASASVERAAHPDEGHSTPWTFALATGLTFETGGKRSARIARARALTLAAQLRLQAAGWDVVQSTREAAMGAVSADVELADARAETAGLTELQRLLQVRFAQGQITRTDLARVAGELQSAAVAADQANRMRTESRLALARALGVPLAEVERLPLRVGDHTGCEVADSLPHDTLETLALTTRTDLGAALADYAAAEADLHEQVARQYPDLTIGPGITWEQGVRRWVLSLGIPAIAIDRARGPIAEARARRAEQAARVTVLQDSILAAVDSSAAACRAARAQASVADSLAHAMESQRQLVEGAYQRGEVGRTELALAQVAEARAQRTRHQATARDLTAGVALERATGLWRSALATRWPDLLAPLDSARLAPRDSPE
ncbi:MAG TPA: TolC family protein [Gemmatimonadaceae bacterium]|jgi:outer membrane protein TolC|nr:TolC family protein [Gemmatimonadaceae bacterium]